MKLDTNLILTSTIYIFKKCLFIFQKSFEMHDQTIKESYFWVAPIFPMGQKWRYLTLNIFKIEMNLLFYVNEVENVNVIRVTENTHTHMRCDCDERSVYSLLFQLLNRKSTFRRMQFKYIFVFFFFRKHFLCLYIPMLRWVVVQRWQWRFDNKSKFITN